MEITQTTEFSENGLSHLEKADWNFTQLIISGTIERDMKLKQFLQFIEFDMDRYSPLKFWFNLNQLSNDEFFVLTDELIDLIGFSKSGSNQNQRSSVSRFIRKNFEEHVDYIEEVCGPFHKIQIKMKKRPFKLLLMKVGTATSELVHEYLVEFEEHCMEYMMYQNTCNQLTIKEQHQQIREAPLMYELDDVIDESKVVKFSDVDDLHCHTNAYLYCMTDMDNLCELAHTMRYPNAMRCNDKWS